MMISTAILLFKYLPRFTLIAGATFCCQSVFGHADAIIRIGDFEQKNYGSWTVQGNAFGEAPTLADDATIRSITGFSETRLATSNFVGGDGATGKLISPQFTIKKSYIAFLIGGGNHPNETCMNLLIDGKIVYSTTGSDSTALKAHHWDVSKYAGKQAVVEVVDAYSGGWGFIAVDHIVQSDTPKPTFPPVASSELTNNGPLKTAFGLKSQLFSNKVINPVAICFDTDNNLYVAETMRFRVGGGMDIRAHMGWYAADYALKTTADRLQFHKNQFDKVPESYFRDYSDQVRRFSDTNQDGTADTITDYAMGFNEVLDGPGAGVVHYNGDVYFTCIPKIWKLEDADGDGQSETQTVLADGFGVHVGISGHDLHGAIIGPDGKLYVSMGDRGYHVHSQEGNLLSAPYTGAVFRCNLDGSELETVLTGLRNPQELVFDDYGNLFTVDNNADIGDRSRVHYLVEGGDAAWSAGRQLLSYKNFATAGGLPKRQPNAWLEDELHLANSPKHPAYLLPPIANLTSGPCGLTVNPGGAALPEDCKADFFVCDYVAGPRSKVHGFSLSPKGAGFEMTNNYTFATGYGVTDVAFGADGKLYTSDYIGGWHEKIRSKGNLYTIWDDAELKSNRVQSTNKELAKGFQNRPAPELIALLDHHDQRVRRNAQFALAEKRDAKPFATAATKAKTNLGRIHAIWGIGQVARYNRSVLKHLHALIHDQNAEIRAQAIRVLGDTRDDSIESQFINALQDASPRVQMHATIALGRIKSTKAIEALVHLLATNNNVDPFVRHGAVMGLAGSGRIDLLKPQFSHPSPAVRIGLVVALRKLKSADLAEFVDDQDAAVAGEAIRAIYDERITDALPAVVALATKPQLKSLSLGNQRRVLQAAARDAGNQGADSLLTIAADNSHSQELRSYALNQLSIWSKPTKVDWITGLPRQAAPRNDDFLQAPMQKLLRALIAQPEMQSAALPLLAQYEVKLDQDQLFSIAGNASADLKARKDALEQLPAHPSGKLTSLLQKLVSDDDETVRIVALALQAKVAPDAALKRIRQLAFGVSPQDVLSNRAERQEAVTLLSQLAPERAQPVLLEAIGAIKEGTLHPGLELDVRLVAKENKAPLVTQALAQIAESQNKMSAAAFTSSLHGGDPVIGKAIFNEHGVAQCMRCHHQTNPGAGPAISGIGSRLSREKILESIVAPSAEVVPGFGISGVSPMPPMGMILNRKEVRDVVAYLVTLKESDAQAAAKVEAKH